MSRARVVFAHPVPESFSASLHRTVVDTLTAKGWQVDDCDLYAEGFNPVLTMAERSTYHDVPANTAPVQSYVDRLPAADALVLVFPVWNFGYPAMLKGFFDRVFRPGVSFPLTGGRVVPALQNIRKRAAVTTYGGTRLRAFLAGDPPRKIVTRALWNAARARKMKYLAMYAMNTATPPRLNGFLSHVQAEMERF